MSTEGSGETPPTIPSLPGAPEQTYLFPKGKGHSRSISHGGTPTLAPTARPPLKSALRGHQRALSHGQIGEGPRATGGPGHSRTGSRTDFILPPGHREPPATSAQPRHASVRMHSRQASRSESIYTIRRIPDISRLHRAALWLIRRKTPTVDNRHLIIIPNHLVPDKTPPKEHPNGNRCNNKVRTTKYTLLSFLPKNLFEQFHRIANVYFIFIVLLNWVPQISAFGKEVAMLPVLFVLTVTAIKDLFEDRRRRLSDKRINNSYCRVFKKSTGRYMRVKWCEVRVGDLVHLSNNEAVPADMVLLHSSNPLGICYLDTCNLDGETNLKQRIVVPGFREKHLDFHPSRFISSVEVERPSTKIYRFTGMISHPDGERVPLISENLLLRECTIKNTDFVEGIVVYAGHETKAMLNNGGPRYKCSSLEKKMNTDVIWCVLVLLFLCCTGAVGCKLFLDRYLSDPNATLPTFLVNPQKPAYEGLLIFWTYIIALQVMIPVSLYVTIEMTKLLQVYHIHQDVEMYDPKTNTRAECRALNITEELGQISYMFSDKTGTLTENKMVFKRCTVNGVDYEHPPGPPAEPSADLPPLVTPITKVSPNSRLLQHLTDKKDTPHSKQVHEFMLMLAVCNTVVVSQPHVDRMQMSNSGNQMVEEKVTPPNGTLRSNDKYSRLTESRSTTPSPPPSTSSPLRLRLPKKLPFLHNTETEPTASSLTVTPTARFEAESPDELALAEAALAYGFELRARAPDALLLGVRGALASLSVLRVQPFDSVRKCMSIALRNDAGQVVVYVKGADSTVFGALAPALPGSGEARALERTRALVAEYARAGLRTLVLARRELSAPRWDEWAAGHARAAEPGEGRERRLRESLARLESALALVGATGVEDRLQEHVPRTVRALLDAGLVLWVLTGDKPETAINIAYSAALFAPSDRLLQLMSRDRAHAEASIQAHLAAAAGACALVVDGRTLTYILDRRSGLVAPFLSLARRCSAVLCCRATPLQKAYIVKAVKEELGVTTLAIGDGANDVSMIQTADVGIGLSGQEGMQAVMASDFALPRFCFVERLLLVHGHWSYDRLARMILYFFFKNATFVFLIFWFQFWCGFSAMVMVDQLHLMLYNLMFTALPPIVIGAYERAAPARLLTARPALYAHSRRGRAYGPRGYWAALLESLYVSLALFLVPLGAYWDSPVGLWQFGVVCTAGCLLVMLLHVALETRSWTLVHVLALAASLGAFVLVTLVFQAACVSCFGLPSTYRVLLTALEDPKSWLVWLLTVVLALGPRLAMHGIRNSLHPGSLRRAVLQRRRSYAAHYRTDRAQAHVYRPTDEDDAHKPPAVT